MSIVSEATEVIEQATKEILALRLQKAVLIEALEDLIEAIPRQTNDCDWWQDDLTKAVKQAKAAVENA